MQAGEIAKEAQQDLDALMRELLQFFRGTADAMLALRGKPQSRPVAATTPGLKIS